MTKLNVTIDQSGYPMMAKEEVEIINKLIFENQPRHCLEWGSGNSTIYFPNSHIGIKSWLSIEHNGHYIKYLRDKVSYRVDMIWIDNLDNPIYVDCVKHNGQKYDFILIDGDQREECLKVALDIVSDDGIILMHDTGRESYQEFIKNYEHKTLYKGEKKIGNGYAHRGLTLFYGESKKS